MQQLNQLIQTVRQKPLLYLPLAGVLILLLILASRSLAPGYQVVNHSPPDGADNVPVTVNLLIELNKPWSENQPPLFTITPATPGEVSLRQGNRQIIFIPGKLLQHDTNYRVNITGPGLDYSFGFRTASSQPLPFATPQTPSATGFPGSETATSSAAITTPGPAQIKQLSNLLKSLPVTTPEYRIKYSPSANMIFVTIYQPPAKESIAKALNYIKGFGFDDPMSELQIDIYVVPSAQDNQPASVSPTATP